MAFNSPPSLPPSLLQVEGLQLEGCSFDGSRLFENQRDSPSLVAMPPCTVAWVTKEATPPYPPSEVVSLPVYHSSDRDRLVICVDVPFSGVKVQWVQSGVALFLKN